MKTEEYIHLEITVKEVNSEKPYFGFYSSSLYHTDMEIMDAIKCSLNKEVIPKKEIISKIDEMIKIKSENETDSATLARIWYNKALTELKEKL